MLKVEGRHAVIQEFGDRFESGHLPEGLPQRVMALYEAAAERLLELLPDSALLGNALHDLWLSKNEAVLLAVRESKKHD